MRAAWVMKVKMKGEWLTATGPEAMRASARGGNLAGSIRGHERGRQGRGRASSHAEAGGGGGRQKNGPKGDGGWMPRPRRGTTWSREGSGADMSGEASTFGRREGIRWANDSWVRGGGAVVLGRDGE